MARYERRTISGARHGKVLTLASLNQNMDLIIKTTARNPTWAPSTDDGSMPDPLTTC